MSLASRIVRRSEVRPEDMDKDRARTDLFKRFGPPPYTSEQYNSVVVTVLPDKDPVSAAEAKARAKFDKALAEAQEREAAARAAYEIAERTHLDAMGALISAEASMPGASGYLVVTRDGQPVQPSRASLADRGAARAADAEARAAFEEAGDQFRRASIKLNAILRRIDTAARLARN